jgi:hypothetical protein
MDACAGITDRGTRCKNKPIDASGYCYSHHPDYEEDRKRYGSKGGKRGGRGRPAPATKELARLQGRLEQLAEDVLSGRIKEERASVAGRLLSYATRCVVASVQAREQEEILERMEALEEALEMTKTDSKVSRRGA